MDLTSQEPFWLLRNGLGEVPPPLPRNRRCDVAVVGAGITGALVCDALTAAGLSVIALDRRHPGHGSTSASTALLQYELDTSLSELTERYGRERAVDAYRATLQGVRDITRIAGDLEDDVDFRKRPSLYYASRKSDVKGLRQECALRHSAALPCEVLGPKAIREIVGFDAPLALWSSVGAEVDPWRMTQSLLARCRKRDISVYGRTEVKRIVAGKHHVELPTNRGVVRARNVVIAAGYEAGKFLRKRVAKLHSTYAIVTEPVKNFDGWNKRCLIWETARPYLYARTTADNRIMVGGEDDPFLNPQHRDARVPAKADKLLSKIRRRFPQIEMEMAYGWAGTFGETKDSLPYIGPYPGGDKRVLFALAYGANGMPFSAVAAEILTAVVLGKSHRYGDTFSFAR